MTENDGKPNEFSVFAEEWTQVTRMGSYEFYPIGPVEGHVYASAADVTISCGCGGSWSGETAGEEFQSHDCLFRGVEFTVEEMFEALNDPTGSRRAHKKDIADGVTDLGFVVQPVFPVRTWETVLETEGPEGLQSGVSPHFAYTIGLWHGHAELIVRGYGDYCADIATFMGRMVLDGRISTEPGVYGFENDHGVDGIIKVVEWSGDPGDFGQAMAHHGTDDFRRVLCVLADDDGLLPEVGGAHVLQLVGLPEWRPEYVDRLPKDPDE